MFWLRLFKPGIPAADALGILYKSGEDGVFVGGVSELGPADWRQRLFDEKAAELILYGRSLGLSEAEAEDTLQETFLALMRLEASPENPPHYAVRAYRNRALNAKRGWFRRLKREWESVRWFEPASAQTDLELAAQRALGRLPADQREVIVLKIWHEMTFDEIAGVLEISANTVAGRYRYGMAKLKKILKGPDYERLDRTEDEGVAAAPGIPGAPTANFCV